MSWWYSLLPFKYLEREGIKDNLDKVNDGVKEFNNQIQYGGKDVAEAFGGLSEKSQDLFNKYKDGKATVSEVFNSVVSDLQGMDDQVKRNTIGQTLMRTLWEDQGKEAILSLGDVQHALGDVNGRMDEMKKLQEESLGQQFQKALRETQAALEPVGKKLAELAQTILPPLVEGIKSVMEWFSKLPEPIQNFTFILLGLVAVIGTLAPIIAVVVVSFGALGVAIWPLLGIIVGLSAVIAGVIWAIKNWGQITDWLSEKWTQFKEWFGELWSNLVQICQDAWSSTTEYFSEAWASFTEMMHEFFDPIGQFFSDLWSGIVETASSWWSSLVEIASELWGTLVQAWQDTWNTILTVLDPIISAVSVVLEAGWLLIQAGTQIAWAAISKYIIDPMVEAYNWCKNQLGELVSWLNSQWETVKSYTLAAWNLVKQYVIQPVQELWNWTKQKLGDLANWILSNWETIKSYTLTAWNLVKKYVIDPVTEAYNSAKQKFSDLYNSAKEKFDAVKNAAKEKFDAAKRFIIDPIKEAVDKVKGFIDKIKGFFDNLKLKIPKPEMPKMPHFSLQTSTKNILGKDIEYPSGLNIDWRAKGGIFTRPTIFGMNGANLQGAGEAGPEGVLPLNEKTLGAIGKGIASTMPQQSNDRPIILQVDGRTFAQITGDYTDHEGGVRIRKIERGLA